MSDKVDNANDKIRIVEDEATKQPVIKLPEGWREQFNRVFESTAKPGPKTKPKSDEELMATLDHLIKSVRD